MAVEAASFFARAIQDHLQLKERNALLENRMPLDRYMADDPFGNHPLFKSEEQARLEETMDGEVVAHTAEDTVLAWAGEHTTEEAVAADASLWSRSRDFDWGD